MLPAKPIILVAFATLLGCARVPASTEAAEEYEWRQPPPSSAVLEGPLGTPLYLARQERVGEP